MIVYLPLNYEVALTSTEIKTVESCREIIGDIIKTLDKKECSTLECEDATIDINKLREISYSLGILLEIEKMY